MNAHEDLNNLLKEQKDVLLGMYQESRNHVRHLESQRATASNIIILTTVGLVSVMATDDLTCEDWPLSVALILLGGYGAMFTGILYESIRRYKDRAGVYCKALEDLLFKREKSNEAQTKGFEEFPNAGDCEPEEKFPKLRELTFLAKVRAFWPLTISLIGIIVTVCIAFLCYGWKF